MLALDFFNAEMISVLDHSQAFHEIMLHASAPFYKIVHVCFDPLQLRRHRLLNGFHPLGVEVGVPSYDADDAGSIDKTLDVFPVSENAFLDFLFLAPAAVFLLLEIQRKGKGSTAVSHGGR